MTTASERKRSEIEKEEADKLWNRLTEVDEKFSGHLGDLERQFSGFGGRLSSIEAKFDNLASGFQSLAGEISQGRKINWNALGVAGPLLIAFVTMAYWIVHREVDHSIEMNAANHEYMRQYEDLREDRAYWKNKAEPQ